VIGVTSVLSAVGKFLHGAIAVAPQGNRGMCGTDGRYLDRARSGRSYQSDSWLRNRAWLSFTASHCSSKPVSGFVAVCCKITILFEEVPESELP